ncbi:ATP-binding protein [Streptomyces sp. NPDC087903]|uniref:ATP-binding protein n=1 Tax=Streptomyces sp. NPDC087903 TaxID=3365819 RepID=UPI00382E1088
MHLDTGSCQSPTSATADALSAPTRPESLSCSFTLPATPRSPGIARAATRMVLRAHDLAEVTDAVVQVVGELAACACLFSPRTELYVSLRYRYDALRVTLYDGHPPHTDARLGAICVLSRRVSLRVLDGVVRDCRGDWGIGGDREPCGGTRMWAVLPRAGACGYLREGSICE